MAQPPPYERAYSFQAWQIANATRPLPADKLEVELEAIETTFDAVLVNLALIQRDDGEVATARAAGALEAQLGEPHDGTSL